jgi:hypothetical protein
MNAQETHKRQLFSPYAIPIEGWSQINGISGNKDDVDSNISLR